MTVLTMKAVVILFAWVVVWHLNLFAQSAASSSIAHEIPKAWEDEALKSMELPLAA